MALEQHGEGHARLLDDDAIHRDPLAWTDLNQIARNERRNLDLFHRNLASVNPKARVIEVSARTGAGLDAWHDWLTATPAGTAWPSDASSNPRDR